MTKQVKWLQFKKARTLVRRLKLSTMKEFKECLKNGRLPENIPLDPRKVYKDKGWISKYDWLGTDYYQYRPRQEWLSFVKARKYARSLNIANSKEWLIFCREGNLPENIPRSPASVYKNRGWISWDDWLGRSLQHKASNYVRTRRKVRNLKIQSIKEWFKLCKKNKIPDGIPHNPEIFYEDNGWGGWDDWLGITHSNGKWRPFEEARQYIHSLKLASIREWREFCHSGRCPGNIPMAPESAYKNEGWIDWYDWLGKPKN